VVAGTLVVILGALAADRSTREFVIGKGREVAANVKAAEPTVGARPVAPVAPVAPEQAETTVQVPVVSIAPMDSAVLNAAPPATARSEEPPPPAVATGAKKAPAVQSKKSQPRSAVRPATQGRTET
jgi:hypothetical protein